MNVQRYVVGFAFDPKYEHVLLILKDHPEWQRGKWNGLGGKMEESDKSPERAIVREFDEECGLGHEGDVWYHVTMLRGPGYAVSVMTREIDLCCLSSAQTCEDEKVRLFRVEDVAKIPPENIISNLRWLIPLCIDFLENVPGNQPEISEVKYAH